MKHDKSPTTVDAAAPVWADTACQSLGLIELAPAFFSALRDHPGQRDTAILAGEELPLSEHGHGQHLRSATAGCRSSVLRAHPQPARHARMRRPATAEALLPKRSLPLNDVQQTMNAAEQAIAINLRQMSLDAHRREREWGRVRSAMSPAPLLQSA